MGSLEIHPGRLPVPIRIFGVVLALSTWLGSSRDPQIIHEDSRQRQTRQHMHLHFDLEDRVVVQIVGSTFCKCTYCWHRYSLCLID
ncbi:hypothetical protein DAI22_04g129100 [Oryza sativa Japonica Group]|nr:hypothetical protein DAI22_04g129100 [Oryza sativa Japonica Group]